MSVSQKPENEAIDQRLLSDHDLCNLAFERDDPV
ncbi:MAG: hypothetical protein BWY82_02627 [Verrucomicrobia bacterium ADurb.Bin474]|nr:MAG: hypothetical protein BWY82_02627 [Verrucomicrobia bacterium ADurb.Bin474]